MNPKLRPIVVVGCGLNLSVLLWTLVTRGSGFTFTTPLATYYIGLNVVCFWAGLAVTVVAGILSAASVFTKHS